MKSVTFATLAVVVGLWGCSSTPSSPDASAASPAEPGKSSSAQTGAATKGGAQTGTAVAPVQAGVSQRPDLKRCV